MSVRLAFSTFYVFNLFGANVAQDAGNTFLRASALKKQEVQNALVAELAGQFTRPGQDERIGQLEADLRPMYTSLPKDADGNLGHTMMRYALHRLLAKEHGWFVIGLEPERDGQNMSVTNIRTAMEWAPSYLQDVLESKLGGRGVSLHELAVLAATLEDLAHKEAVGRLQAVYEIYNLPSTEVLNRSMAAEVIDSYALVYFKGGNWTAKEEKEAHQRVKNFRHNHKNWKRLSGWLREISHKYQRSDGAMSFDMVEQVVDRISHTYGFYNQEDCNGLKASLVEIEDQMPGRVLLSDFYKRGLYGQWQFTEKVDYLRTLGALDETTPDKPRVIIPNYVGSRPQCREASGLYAVCCPDECEALVGQLETHLAEPTGLPQRIADLIKTFSTASVAARGELSESLLSKLEQVAAAHGGRVPLHGRLFAQWLHHAFPRECPFPHESGTTSPQTAEEWMRKTGQEASQASEEEMVCYVSGPCAGGSAASSEKETAKNDNDMIVEIPWTDHEELMNGDLSFVAKGSAFSAHATMNGVLRTLVMSAVALGLAIASKMPIVDAQGETTKSLQAKPWDWWASRLLLFCPLFIVTADYVLDLSCVNEFALCGLCWGLASMMMYGARRTLSSSCLPFSVIDDAGWKAKSAV